MGKPHMTSLDTEPLTAKQDTSGRCGNPFCQSPMQPGRGKRYCCDPCRMDGYVLRRAKAMLQEVGTSEFNRLLEMLRCSR
jgi:hypothetical protein